jgi:hypothetical protein
MASPVMKNLIDITGTNFGTVKEDINVYLMNSDYSEVKYDLII